MQTQTSPFLTEQIVSRIFSDGELSRDDRQKIQSALLNTSIDEKELSLIEKIMEGVVKGILDVLN
ncbi:MAG TPA: hypothetical protein DD001_07535 [Microcoleaceae bacterium UBA10368]|jgi:hypothetical protein|nr:hypothetical protein [Microcoleaceae cyanobacterium UBA11344]HBK97182.1 hypothetical protein [Microcoleaceae cyanobacterium UBA10368]HCV32040.1 hypothetical protein [Microcoleaceae cyanobacterium UBA9251]